MRKPTSINSPLTSKAAPSNKMYPIIIPRKRKNLLANLCSYFRCPPHRLRDVLWTPHYFNHVNNMYSGVRFRTIYRPHMLNRTIIFGSLSWMNASQLAAYEGAIDRMSVLQHYYGKYKLRLKYPYLPCVVVYGPRGHNRYYPLELLTLCE